jgi:hypothetical protein
MLPDRRRTTISHFATRPDARPRCIRTHLGKVASRSYVPEAMYAARMVSIQG